MLNSPLINKYNNIVIVPPSISYKVITKEELFLIKTAFQTENIAAKNAENKLSMIPRLYLFSNEKII